MTIGRGAPWGERVPRPVGLRSAADDRELAFALSDGSGTPTTVESGDMLRTLGGLPAPTREPGDGSPTRDVLAVPIDLIRVSLDGGPAGHAVAHLLLRGPVRRGGMLLGPVVMVMNAEFMGVWDVAPRGHPNDGRVEIVSCDAQLGVRQRLTARRRLPAANHLPHPGISSRSLAESTWSFDRPITVLADGRRIGTARTVEIAVLADAATLYV